MAPPGYLHRATCQVLVRVAQRRADDAAYVEMLFRGGRTETNVATGPGGFRTTKLPNPRGQWQRESLFVPRREDLSVGGAEEE